MLVKQVDMGCFLLPSVLQHMPGVSCVVSSAVQQQEPEVFS